MVGSAQPTRADLRYDGPDVAIESLMTMQTRLRPVLRSKRNHLGSEDEDRRLDECPEDVVYEGFCEMR